MKNTFLSIVNILLITFFAISVSATSFYNEKSGFSLGASAGKKYTVSIKEAAFDALPDENGNDIKDEMENLESGKTVTMDPVLVSNSPDDTWGFIKVVVPTVNSTLSVDDGKTVHDVFVFTPSDDFKLLKSEVSNTQGTPSIYYYGYKKRLPKNSETTPLFTEIRVNDFVQNDAVEDVAVTVIGAVIQARSVNSVDDAFLDVQEF